MRTPVVMGWASTDNTVGPSAKTESSESSRPRRAACCGPSGESGTEARGTSVAAGSPRWTDLGRLEGPCAWDGWVGPSGLPARADGGADALTLSAPSAFGASNDCRNHAPKPPPSPSRAAWGARVRCEAADVEVDGGEGREAARVSMVVARAGGRCRDRGACGVSDADGRCGRGAAARPISPWRALPSSGVQATRCAGPSHRSASVRGDARPVRRSAAGARSTPRWRPPGFAP